MASPSNLASQLPPGDDHIMREIADIKRQIKELTPSIAKSFNTVVDALIFAESNAAGHNNMAFTTTSTTFASVSFTVPDGYTRCLVTASAAVMGLNSGATGDYIYGQIAITPSGGSTGEIYQYAPAGIAASLTVPYYVDLSDLVAGWTLTLSVNARTNTGTWAASVSNEVNLYAGVQFLK